MGSFHIAKLGGQTERSLGLHYGPGSKESISALRHVVRDINRNSTSQTAKAAKLSENAPFVPGVSNTRRVKECLAIFVECKSLPQRDPSRTPAERKRAGGGTCSAAASRETGEYEDYPRRAL